MHNWEPPNYDREIAELDSAEIVLAIVIIFIAIAAKML